MKKQIIEIMTKNGIAKVDGYVIDDTFAVTKSATGKTWCVTDIASGLTASRVGYNTRKEAIASVPEAYKSLNRLMTEKPENYANAVNKFNELKEGKTMKKTSKATKTAKASKTAKTSKKPTQKEIIAKLEKENAELKERIKSLETPEIKGIEAFDIEGYMATRDNSARITPELIKALQETEGLKVEFHAKGGKVVKKFTGTEWLYVKGDTRPLKEIFNALKFRFSGKETAWFLAPYPIRNGAKYAAKKAMATA